MTEAGPRVEIERLRELVEQALRRACFGPGHVRSISDTIVASEIDGVASHGLLRLPGFIEAVRTGWADGQARPQMVKDVGATLVVDAANGFAQSALNLARDKLEEAARKNGVAVLLVRDAHHFGALAPDIEPSALAGFVVLSCVNSRKRMNAWGGCRPVVGTNAIAFAAPRSGRPPFIWDQSCSVMSQGDLLLAARDGRDVPVGTGLDGQGRPTTSAAAILDGGTLFPFGGGKGASIAVMVEILSAALTGSCFGFENPVPPSSSAPSKGGQFLLLVDPAVGASDFASRVSALGEAIIDAGAERLPSDRRYQARLCSRSEGVRPSAASYATLLELAGEREG
jgi:delta1-piperideine-2-carboxylate reductase